MVLLNTSLEKITVKRVTGFMKGLGLVTELKFKMVFLSTVEFQLSQIALLGQMQLLLMIFIQDHSQMDLR